MALAAGIGLVVSDTMMPGTKEVGPIVVVAGRDATMSDATMLSEKEKVDLWVTTNAAGAGVDSSPIDTELGLVVHKSVDDSELGQENLS